MFNYIINWYNSYKLSKHKKRKRTAYHPPSPQYYGPYQNFQDEIDNVNIEVKPSKKKRNFFNKNIPKKKNLGYNLFVEI